MDIVVHIGDRLSLQPAVFNSLIVIICLCIFIMVCGAKVNKADPSKPSKGLVFFMEFAVSSIEKMANNMIGDKTGKYAPFIGFLIFYLIPINLLGLLGLTTPSSNYNVTLSLALVTLTYIALSGVQAKGLWGYLKDTYFGNMPALFLLNVIGEAAKLISLSFRLFGNILSGVVMLTVIMTLMGWLVIPILPALSIYFNIFAGVMQTAVFCILTMIWLQGATSRER